MSTNQSFVLNKTRIKYKVGRCHNFIEKYNSLQYRIYIWGLAQYGVGAIYIQKKKQKQKTLSLNSLTEQRIIKKTFAE